MVQKSQFKRQFKEVLGECKSGLGYFIPLEVLFLNAQNWVLLPKITYQEWPTLEIKKWHDILESGHNDMRYQPE